MLSGIVFQIFYGLIGSWTAYLISVLYMEYRTRKEKENVNFKNHVIQWLEVLEGLLGPYWKAVGLAFNCTFLLFGSVIQLIGCARRFTHIDEDCHPELEQLGCCLAELSLLDYYYVQFLPSMIAASVVLLGKFILNSKKHPWSKSLQNGTGYSPSDLRECILRLDHFQKDAKHRDEIKSAREKFAGVTSLPFEPSIPDDYFHTSED